MIEITDPAFSQHKVPGGVLGQAAVYSEHFHRAGVLGKVLLSVYRSCPAIDWRPAS